MGEVRLKGFVLSFQMGEKNKHMYADGNDPTEIKKKKTWQKKDRENRTAEGMSLSKRKKMRFNVQLKLPVFD